MFQAKGAVGTTAGRMEAKSSSRNCRAAQGSGTERRARDQQRQAGRALLPGGLQDQAGGTDRARGVPSSRANRIHTHRLAAQQGAPTS